MIRSAPSDPHAELARSILACPEGAGVAVDGFPTVEGDDHLSFSDEDGTPTFTCRTWSLMAHAGRATSRAVLTLTSGLGPAGGPARAHSLALTGRLRPGPVGISACCGGQCQDIALELDRVLLTLGSPRGESRVAIPVRAFASAELRLNRGYLQRATEHANDCHQDELRAVVARASGRPSDGIIGVSLSGLTVRGAELSWVDWDGADRLAVAFDRPARTTGELAVLLRRHLHTDLC